MPPPTCLRSFAQLSRDKAVHASLSSQTACFSTSAARFAQSKPRVVAPPRRGEKTLNVKKGHKGHTQDTGKRPAIGERREQRRRIVLTNDNALEVASLRDLHKGNTLSEGNKSKMMAFPPEVVDALRAVEAFKPSQGWGLFRRPASLMRKETMQLASLIKEVEDAKDDEQGKTIRRVLSGKRMSGKSTLVLQGLAMAHLREWVIINLPDGRHHSSPT
jgi:small subunit ribosomal protein S29